MAGGRPKGSRNKLTLNITRSVQEAILTECDINKMVRELYREMFREDTKPSDKAKIFDTLLKYGAVPAHVELTDDGEVKDNASKIVEIMQKLM